MACFRYGWSDLGVADCTAKDAVKPGADGTAAVSLKVLNWGTNSLNVQVIDTAGNVSGGRTSSTPGRTRTRRAHSGTWTATRWRTSCSPTPRATCST